MKSLVHSLLAFVMAVFAASEEPVPRLWRMGDLNTSPVVAEPSGAGGVRLDQDIVIFAGRDGECGEEIWKFDGAANARLLLDLRPGPDSSLPCAFAPLTGTVFSCVVEDGLTGTEVIVLNADGEILRYESGLDLSPGRDHAAPRLLGHASGLAWYVVDGSDPFGRPGEAVWQFEAGSAPVWLDTFKAGSVRQPRNGHMSDVYFVGRRWNEAELGLFRVHRFSFGVEKAGMLGTPEVAEPLPDHVYAVTPGMVCYRDFAGSQPILRAFRVENPSNVLSQSLGPVLDPCLTSNGHDRICYAGHDSATGIEPWMLVDDFSGAPLAPQLVVDVNSGSSSSLPSHLSIQDGNLYLETGTSSRALRFVDTSSAIRVSETIFVDSQDITWWQAVSSREVAYVVSFGESASIRLYDTGSLVHRVLESNVVVKDVWSTRKNDRGLEQGLNAIVGSAGQERLRRLAGTIWNTVQSFEQDTASRLLITGAETAGDGWVTGNPGEGKRRLIHYPFDTSGVASFVSMQLEQPYHGMENASSHPADFHEIDGHLFFTAQQEGRRLLFATPNGAPDSVQPVPLLLGDGSGSTTFEVSELMKLGNRLFLRSAMDNTLCQAVVEPAPVGPVVHPVMDGAAAPKVERLTVAAGKVFFVQSDATMETLRHVDTALTFGTVHAFEKPPGGPAVTQMTGSADRLFFTAAAVPSDASTPVIPWSSQGGGMIQCPSFIASPHFLGLWAGQCVFWRAYGAVGDYWDLFTWSGVAGEHAQSRWGGPAERRPESSHKPGFPSCIEFDGRLVYCDRLGALVVLGAVGMNWEWRNHALMVRPEFLVVENGRLIWQAFAGGWGPAQWDVRSLSWDGSGAPSLLWQEWSVPSTMHGRAGMAWSALGQANSTLLLSTNGAETGMNLHDEAIHPGLAAGSVPMGTYRGRLVLAARSSLVSEQGFEPALLYENTPPQAADPLKLQGARQPLPFEFGYDDLAAFRIIDAESDPVSVVSIWPHSATGHLKRNGQMVFGPASILPGDVFEWTPSTGEIGDTLAFMLLAADQWDDNLIPVTVRVETPQEEWTRQHFLPEDLANPLISGPAADADGDGVCNALEFLFGRLPQSWEVEPGWSLSAAPPSAGLRTATFRFNRLAVLPQETTLRIERSDNLHEWQVIAEKMQNTSWSYPADEGITVEESMLPDGRMETRIIVVEDAAANRFLRLRVLLP